jgi:cytidyltransferase-like protein
MKTIILITGGFDPLHSGHIAYFKAAKKLGDILVVGVNSDSWLTRKKGIPFMPFNERAEIVRNIIGDDVKFADHYASLGMEAELSTAEQPLFKSGNINLNKIKNIFEHL